MKGLCLTLLAAAAFAAASGPAAAAGISVSVTGGYGRIGYGDFNDWVESTNASLAGIAELNKMNWVPEAAAELRYALAPTLSGGLGIGYMKGTSDFEFRVGADAISYGHTMRAVPLTATVHWEPPLVALKPYVFGGLGTYHAKLTFRQSFTQDGATESFEADLSAWGFGLHGGAGVRFPIVPTVAFDIGVRLRRTEIAGFKGSAVNQDGETWDAELVKDSVEDPVSGTIDYYGPWPAGGIYRQGAVDLSGFSIYVGISAGF